MALEHKKLIREDVETKKTVQEIVQSAPSLKSHIDVTRRQIEEIENPDRYRPVDISLEVVDAIMELMRC